MIEDKKSIELKSQMARFLTDDLLLNRDELIWTMSGIIKGISLEDNLDHLSKCRLARKEALEKKIQKREALGETIIDSISSKEEEALI